MLNLLKKSRRAGSAAELRAVLGDAEVPTFPTPVIRTLEALRSPRSTAAEVADALSADPGLTVRLLKLVNSAGFSPVKPVTSVDQAVAIAGFGAVESLVLSVGVNAVMPRRPVEGYEQARFWRAASRRAVVAKGLATELHPATSSLSFTAGLLQDMAIPLLAASRDDYSPLLVEWHNGGEDLHRLEAEAFDWGHSDVAEWLCQGWELPDSLSKAIRGHHEPQAQLAPPAVLLAAPLREEDQPEILEAVVTSASEDFGMKPDRVVAIIDEATASADELATLFI